MSIETKIVLRCNWTNTTVSFDTMSEAQAFVQSPRNDWIYLNMGGKQYNFCGINAMREFLDAQDKMVRDVGPTHPVGGWKSLESTELGE